TAVLSRTGRAIVVAVVRGGMLTLTVREVSIRLTQAKHNVVHEGPDWVDSYHAHFILYVLRVYDNDQLRITFDERDVPATFKPVDGDDRFCIIMPVRLG